MRCSRATRTGLLAVIALSAFEASLPAALAGGDRSVVRHQVYAPPLKYGPWQAVAAHGGQVQFQINVTPIGSTEVFGEVRYFGADGKPKMKQFRGAVSIKTGNAWGNVEVRLKGVPTGSSCYVDVNP